MTQDKIIESLIKETSTRLQAKQKQLSFDNYPVENSNNLVTSDGVKKYIDDKPDGGSEVVANPSMQGDEDILTGLQVDQDKYKIPTTVVQGSTAFVDAPQIKTICIQDTIYAVPHIDAYKAVKTNDVSPHFKSFTDEWTRKTWSGLTNFEGDRIWTDGENVYYSDRSSQYVLDKTTSTWSEKTWSGLTNFYGDGVWTDGENIYFSDSTYNIRQYVLDKATSTWTRKTWSGLTNFNGQFVWTDGENIYYSLGSTRVLDKATSTWYPKDWSGLTSFNGSYIWTDGENIYCSSGTTQYVLDKNTSTWSSKSWSGLTNFYSSGIWTDGENIYYSANSEQYVLDKATSTWSRKTWSGLTSFRGYDIWTDGENVYYSGSLNGQYVLNKNTLFSVSPVLKKEDIISFNSQEVNTTEILQNIYMEGQVYDIAYPNISTTPPDGLSKCLLDKATPTWSPKVWSGLTSFSGENIWTDGDNIYYSSSSVLDKATLTWSPKEWSGLTSFFGNDIWTDGENIYYSYDSNQYVLNKATSTWTQKTWTGLTSFYGSYIWTDGDNIYYSNGSTYVLNKTTSTWTRKTWTGLTSFYGSFIWTDGDNIYYSEWSNQYVLDKTTLTWSLKSWNGLTSFCGAYIWTDGDNIYYSDRSSQYVLDKTTSTWAPKTWTGLTDFSGGGIWTDGKNIYYSYKNGSDSTQYILNKNTILSTKEYLRTGEIDFNTADDISKLDQIYGLRINGVEYKAIYNDLQVNNLTESNGIISWEAPDISKYASYQPSLSYSMYINNVKISDTTDTSYDASAVLVSGNTYTIEVKANLSLQNSIDSSIEITN